MSFWFVFFDGKVIGPYTIEVGRPGLEWLFLTFVAGIGAGAIAMLVGVGLLAAHWVERLALRKSL